MQNRSLTFLLSIHLSCWSDPRAFALLCDELSMTLKYESEMTLSAAIANASLDAGPDAAQVFSQTQSRQASTHKELIKHLHHKICELFQVFGLAHQKVRSFPLFYVNHRISHLNSTHSLVPTERLLR